MVDDPLEWLRRLPKGIGYAVIHLEAIEDLEKTITWVRSIGVKVFVALSSETPTRAPTTPASPAPYPSSG
jgi:pentose-5-phosphate-3-epimerase